MMYDNDVGSVPPAALRLHWDVFLSFRGEDTRSTFTTKLYDSLTERGVRVFMDDVGMTLGDGIASKLLEAIEDSAAAIIIFSPRYGDSHWCLEELARICELNRLVLPVFYKVDPSDVRRQRGPFEKDFTSHSGKFDERSVARWRYAMQKIGGLKGEVFDGSKEQELVQRLINRIWTELRQTPVGIATYTVGLDSRVEKLMRLMDVKSSCVKVLGLHGIGGIGKTTLAKALYNKLIGHFEHRCFISDVRESAKASSGLLSLQNKLLGGLLKLPSVDDIDEGISAIKRMFHGNRVLVVLDDVDDKEQLNALAGHIDWFSEGSRIIITTRNKEALDRHLVNEFFEVRELYESEALQLFSHHALGLEKPTDEYLKLSEQMVSLTGKLPLALEVFGSFLYHRRKVEDWKVALNDLQKIRPRNLQDVLKLSYDSLDEEEKCVFLDVACLFVKVGMERQEAIDILRGCGFRAETAIKVLTERSLVKITEDFTLWMHDQVRDMGRQIVLQENLEPLGMHSRMWDQNEIIAGLKYEKKATNVQGIVLDFGEKKVVHSSGDHLWDTLLRSNFTSVLAFLREKFNICVPLPQYRAVNYQNGEVILSTKPFESMVNLRLLHINYARLEGKFKNFPVELKWLKWKGCPLKKLPSDYFPWQLAVLDLSHSGIEQVWSSDKKKVPENLKVLNLQYCYNLVDIPDLSGCITLEKVNLEHCIRLTKLHKSIGNVGTLLWLNLQRCKNLVELPSDCTGLKLLQNLYLSGCSNLKALPDDLGTMISLKELLLDGTAISKLPESIYRLTKLEKLTLNHCQHIRQLPIYIGNLTSLIELSVDHTSLEELPISIGSLSKLEKLSLMWCALLTAIPESVNNLQMLTEISLHGSAITELPASIGSLSYLRVLSAGECRSLTKLPDSVGELACLTELQLDNTSISHLPDQVGGLKMVKMLYMRNCMSLTLLPEAVGSMLFLTSINLVGSNIMELPESIGLLENLVMLRLNKCKKLQKLPASIGNLKSLHILMMEHTAVNELPDSFGMLSCLMVLKMRKMPSETSITEDKSVVLPSSFSNLSLLEELDARAWRISGKIPDDFEKLSFLENLDLGYNNFHSLPSSLRGLSLLKKLILLNCEKLMHLPPLPSSLEELDVRNCVALESVSDVSNLEKLVTLNTTNCKKVVDIPGLECLKSLRRLYMSGCIGCSSTVKRRLSKVCLRNMYNLSIPGSEIPNWFSPDRVRFSERRNREIRAVIICIVVSVEFEDPEDSRYQLPVVPDIEAQVLDGNRSILNTTLDIQGIPKTNADHIHLCRYSRYRPLVSMLRNGYMIEVRRRTIPIIEGVKLKKCGIHLVYENDDDYDANEQLLDETQKSVSEKLANFFNSLEDD